MLQPERRKAIMKELKKNEVVKVDDLSRMFEVSEMTIRRDLDAFEEKGLIKRTRGGAVLLDGLTLEVPYLSKEVLNIEKKEKIALGAVKYIKKGMVIALDGGTTSMEIAKLIAPDSSLTVITADVMIAAYLSNHSKMNIICTGGYVQNNTGVCLGSIAECVLGRVKTDISFIGTSGFTLEGITTPTLDKEGLKRRLIKAGKKTILVTDSSKYNRENFIRIADIDDFDLIITDKGLEEKAYKALKEKVQVDLV